MNTLYIECAAKRSREQKKKTTGQPASQSDRDRETRECERMKTIYGYFCFEIILECSHRNPLLERPITKRKKMSHFINIPCRTVHSTAQYTAQQITFAYAKRNKPFTRLNMKNLDEIE